MYDNLFNDYGPIETNHDITATRRCPKFGAMSWSCNCEGRQKDNYVTMHVTKADGEGKCVLCGHYAYRIENHKLYAKCTWLHKIDKK